jgi:hypothetical protein
MKSQFKFLILLAIFVSTNVLAQTQTKSKTVFTGAVLTHEQFLNLYEADQKKYVMLLRQAAIELSYRDNLSYSAIEVFNESRSPASFTDVEAAAGPGATVCPVVPQSGSASTSLLNYFQKVVVSFSPFLPLIIPPLLMPPSIIPYIFPVTPTAGPKPSPTPSKAVAASTDQTIRVVRTNESTAISADLSALSLATSMDTSAAASEDNSCVRCIYGGFVISGKQSCEPVRNSSQMLAQLGEVKFKAPMVASQLKCPDIEAKVMCNPMLFGTKGGKAICIATSKTATQDCAAAAGTDSESIEVTKDLLKSNPVAFKKLSDNLIKICNYDSLCYSEARKEDIRTTCGTLHTYFDKFKENMRLVKAVPVVPAPVVAASADESPPAPVAPVAPPTRVREGDNVSDGIRISN